MPVYFIRSDQIHHDRVDVGTELNHHLRNVLRVKRGETITLVDERPRKYLARILNPHSEPITLQIEAETFPPKLDLTSVRLCVGLLKREKMDWIVQKATELGVSRITPLITERTIIRPQAKRTIHQVQRWVKIATEAAQQSCRWNVPSVDVPMDVNLFLGGGQLPGFQFIFSEHLPATACREKIQNKTAGAIDQGSLLIGPEGGWTLSEIGAAERAGFIPLSLGERILRTETAALAALTIIQYELSNGDHRAPISR